MVGKQAGSGLTSIVRKHRAQMRINEGISMTGRQPDSNRGLNPHQAEESFVEMRQVQGSKGPWIAARQAGQETS